MKRYALKTKTGEKLDSTIATDSLDAAVYFSLRKKLELNDLLDIFIIEEIF